MLDPVKDECGLTAAAVLEGDENAAHYIPGMLLDIQNRGQLAAGITSYDGDRRQLLRTHKALGSVNDVFAINDRKRYTELIAGHGGPMAIGHTRYSTCGADDVGYAQPYERVHGRAFKWMSFCFNGNVANHAALLRKLEEELGYHLTRPDSDSELFMHILAYQQRGSRPRDWVKAFSDITRTVDGAWSMALLTATGDLIVARDPTGIKPLCWGRLGDVVLFCSESIALQNLGVEEIVDVAPGTLVWVRGTQVRIERFARERSPNHCFFEWVYFANVASTIDGRSVYQARANMGKALAEIEEEEIGDDHIVVPVPDTSKAAGDAFAFSLGLPSIEGLVRNRYVGRTFIETEDRARKVRRKFVALRGILEGKKVLLLDDSIVRGTTLKYLISYIREVGRAREVHVRIACPPIMSPCFYGIDMSTIGELFAPRFLEEPMLKGRLPLEVRREMAASIGADSLQYLPIDRLSSCIGVPNRHLCRACVTREYPTPTGQRLLELAQANHQQGVAGRTTQVRG